MQPDVDTRNDEPLVMRYLDGNSEGFDLGLLGESFSGFSGVLSDLCELTNIKGKIHVRTTRIEHGSIEVFNLIQVVTDTLPFARPQDLLDFLRVADQELFEQARTFFNAVGNAHDAMSAYFEEHSFEGNLLANLIGSYIIFMLGRSQGLKSRSPNKDNEIEGLTARQASKLRTMIATGRYRKAMKPLTEGNVSAIVFAGNAHTSASAIVPTATITEHNVGNYLPDESKILPELLNGQVVKLSGKVVGLQNTKGDILKIKVNDIAPQFSLLIAYPDDDKASEDYKDFYGQEVVVTAEILRRSQYKKPEIKIKAISARQTSLIEEEE